MNGHHLTDIRGLLRNISSQDMTLVLEDKENILQDYRLRGMSLV